MFAGIPLSLLIVARDVLNLMNILRMHEGCRKFADMKDELKVEEIDEDIKLSAY